MALGAEVPDVGCASAPDTAPRTRRPLLNLSFPAPGHSRARERHLRSQGRVLGSGPFPSPADTQWEPLKMELAGEREPGVSFLENEVTSYRFFSQHEWLRGTLTALSACVRKRRPPFHIHMYVLVFTKGAQRKPKARRREEMIKIRIEISETVKRKI